MSKGVARLSPNIKMESIATIVPKLFILMSVRVMDTRLMPMEGKLESCYK